MDERLKRSSILFRSVPRWVLCVLLGIATTVAVAWACGALGAPRFRSRSERLFAAKDEMIAIGWIDSTIARTCIEIAIGPSAPWEAVYTRAELRTTSRRRTPFDIRESTIWRERQRISNNRFQIDCCGLPFRAMSCTWSLSVVERGGVMLNTPPSQNMDIGTAIPLRIMPIGFTLDSILFAVLWYFVWSYPGAYRRYARKIRGECPSCGYSLRGGVGGRCPECGETLNG